MLTRIYYKSDEIKGKGVLSMIAGIQARHTLRITEVKDLVQYITPGITMTIDIVPDIEEFYLAVTINNDNTH